MEPFHGHRTTSAKRGGKEPWPAWSGRGEPCEDGNCLAAPESLYVERQALTSMVACAKDTSRSRQNDCFGGGHSQSAIRAFASSPKSETVSVSSDIPAVFFLSGRCC